MKKNQLKRHITLPTLILFGMGDILGAGVYGLIGKAAGVMGNGVWMAFLVSMVAAGFTGLSYASLGSRYPHSGGASFITLKAYRSKFLAYTIGLAVLASGLTSMAAASRAFAGYFSGLVPIHSQTLIIIGFALLISWILFRGIRETVFANSFITLIEISGLVLIILFGFKYIGSTNYLDITSVQNPEGHFTFPLLLSGAVLTFYSFIGFEDILNVSEEVIEPEKTLHKGLLFAVLGSSLIYMLISVIAVSVVPHQQLAASKQPLIEVVELAAPWFPLPFYSVIALLAVSNTALLNYLMGSRLLYGMASQGLMPSFLSRVHKKRATPHWAILVILFIFLALALSGDISSLARATSVLLLLCFSFVNLGLFILKRTDPNKGRFEVPAFIPVCGLLFCLAMLLQAKKEELMIAGVILAVIAGLYFLLKPTEEAIADMERQKGE